MSAVLAYADDRGRDGFAFDHIESRYLEVADDLRIRTPYSKTVVEELRAVPWAWWDGDLKAWRVPFRSWEDLQRRWPAIEAAAQRNEPVERQKRQQARRGTAARQNVNPNRAGSYEQGAEAMWSGKNSQIGYQANRPLPLEQLSKDYVALHADCRPGDHHDP